MMNVPVPVILGTAFERAQGRALDESLQAAVPRETIKARIDSEGIA